MIYESMCNKQKQHNIALSHSHQHKTNNILLNFFNNTQQQHNDMPMWKTTIIILESFVDFQQNEKATESPIRCQLANLNLRLD